MRETMTIDFKEIPKANIGDGMQDAFEMFSREFLQMLGFTILSHPDRGADDQKDMIILEDREGIVEKTTVKWLVSCKHYAHSKKSISTRDETSILDRVKAHKCDGFLGFYSTLCSAALNKRLIALKDDIFIKTFDWGEIENVLINRKSMDSLFVRFFPKSYKKYKKLEILNKEEKEKFFVETTDKSLNIVTVDNLYQACLTANMIMKLEEFKRKFFESDWSKKEEIFDQIFNFSYHSNNRISYEIITFLDRLACQTRYGMTKKLVSNIFSAVLEFCPSLDEEENLDQAIEIAKKCIRVGNEIVYDSLIKLHDLEIAMFGLNIIKFIYRESSRNRIAELTDKVNEVYDELERTILDRDKDDLKNAYKLIQAFRADLNESSLGFPVVLKELTADVEKPEKKKKKWGNF